MKKQFTLLCLILFCYAQLTNAQPYPSIFGTEKSQINILNYCSPSVKGLNTYGQTLIYNIENDTIIEQQLYKKISYKGYDDWFYDFSIYSGIREDTIEGKVFVYGKPFGEILTCDFSLAIGDTFFFPQYDPQCLDQYMVDLNRHNGFMVADSIYYIDGKKVITFDGPYYRWGEEIRKYDLYNFAHYLQELVFIEGVGPNYGPLGWYCVPRMLLCTHKDNDLVYMQREDLGCWYYECPSNVNEIMLDRINIYPNPTTGELTITNYELKIMNVDVYDVYGRKLQSKIVNLQSEIVINISHLPAGVYFVKIRTEAGEVVRKVVKE